MKGFGGAVMGRRAGAGGCTGRTEPDPPPCGAGSPGQPLRRGARQLLLFPEEGPTKLASTRGVLAGARSHTFLRLMNHNIEGSRWDV